MSPTPIRALLVAGLLLLLLSLAPLAATTLAQDAEVAEAQVSVESVDPLAVYIVEVMDKIERYHPAGGDLTREQMVTGARDAVLVALRRNERLPVGQRDELIEWLTDREFNSVYQLLHVLNRFSRNYTELDMVAIADTAARGAVSATGDQFSRLMTMEELQQMQQQMMSPEDRSLGIVPAPIPNEDDILRLEVSHLRRGYLGFELGLQKGDEILEVNGQPIASVARERVNALLEADRGQRVQITIRRDGFDEPITLVGQQRTTSHPAARGRMLPGDIAYISTNMFSLDFGTVLRADIENFVRQGAIGLILDLRNNPGGAMNACTQVADDFLPSDAVITYTKGTYRNPFAFIQRLFGLDDGERIDDETSVYRSRNPQRFDLPLVVLVNEMSASASEMLSAALKSHERAVIVGETTYGKGIGQTAVMLNSNPTGEGGGGLLGGLMGGGDMRMLMMTVMTYFGPNHEDVHDVGVEPHVVVPESRPDAEVFDRVARLRSSDAVRGYIQHVGDEHRRFLRRQVMGSPAPLVEYPQIERLREHEAARSLSDETLAREVRHALVAHFNLNANLADDNQLQVAILEVAKLANLELEGVEEYRHFGD